MLTALGESSGESVLLNGANDYIVKPFNLDEVFARITVQLRSQMLLSRKNIWVSKIFDYYQIHLRLHVVMMLYV